MSSEEWFSSHSSIENKSEDKNNSQSGGSYQTASNDESYNYSNSDTNSYMCDTIPEKDKHNFRTAFDYLIGEELGRGGNGVVYKGVFGPKSVVWIYRNRSQCLSGQRFAVKYVNIKDLSQSDSYKEAETLEKLHHKNIIDVYSIITINRERLYIFMEFADLTNLQYYFSKLASNSRIEEKQTLVWCEHILSGMNFMYQNNLIHGDLHAANILLVTDSQTNEIIAKVSDFGTVDSDLSDITVHRDIYHLAIIFKELFDRTNFESNNGLDNSTNLINNMVQNYYKNYEQILLDLWIERKC